MSATEARPSAGELEALTGLLGEVGDLKRLRVAGRAGTLAAQAYRRAWAGLAGGEEPGKVARREVAAAVAAARLGGIDRATLVRCGLPDDEARSVLEAGFDAVADPIPGGLRRELRRALADPAPAVGAPPSFVDNLEAQPRAGATQPGHGRLVLEPPESHADHCMTVATYAVLLAPAYGADVAVPFLVGMAHHLHNAVFPDSGFAGDVLLGERVEGIHRRLQAEALAELPGALRSVVAEAVGLVHRADTPEARAFQAADVLDRVLQMRQYARVAAFELRQALEMDLVHEGPVQAFQLDVVAAAGLDPGAR